MAFLERAVLVALASIEGAERDLVDLDPIAEPGFRDKQISEPPKVSFERGSELVGGAVRAPRHRVDAQDQILNLVTGYDDGTAFGGELAKGTRDDLSVERI